MSILFSLTCFHIQTCVFTIMHCCMYHLTFPMPVFLVQRYRNNVSVFASSLKKDPSLIYMSKCVFFLLLHALGSSMQMACQEDIIFFCPRGECLFYCSLLSLLFLLSDFFLSELLSLNCEKGITHLITPVSLCYSLCPSVSLSSFELCSGLIVFF